MRTFDAQQLAAMKPQFIAYLETDWCPCRDFAADNPTDPYWLEAEHHLPDGSPCNCYGRDEFDDVELATIDDDAVVIHYHGRTLTLPANRDAGPDATAYDEFLAVESFITQGDTRWIGDDCDYYGAIVHWLDSLR